MCLSYKVSLVTFKYYTRVKLQAIVSSTGGVCFKGLFIGILIRLFIYLFIYYLFIYVFVYFYIGLEQQKACYVSLENVEIKQNGCFW